MNSTLPLSSEPGVKNYSTIHSLIETRENHLCTKDCTDVNQIKVGIFGQITAYDIF